MTAEEIFKAYANSSTPMPDSVIKWIISHSEGMSKAFTTVLNNLQQNPPKTKKIQMGSNFSTSEYPLPHLITAVKQAERGTGLRIELLFPKQTQPNYESIMPNLNYKGLDKHLGVLSYPIIARNPKRGLSPQDASSAISYARRIALATILNLSSGNSSGGSFGGYNSYRSNYTYGNSNRQYTGGSRYPYQNGGSYRGNQSSPMNNNYQYNRQRYQNNSRGNGGAPRNFNQAEASSSNTASASPKQNQYKSSSMSEATNSKPKTKPHKSIKKLTSAQAQHLKDAMNKMYSSTHMKKRGILRIIKSASGMSSSQRFPSQFPADKYDFVMKTIKSFIKPANKQTPKSKAK